MKAKKTLVYLIVSFTILAIVAFQLCVYGQQKQYRKGVGALKEGNYELALKLIEPYAKDGDSNARGLVGEMYALGLGVPIDHKRAQQWFECTGISGCIDGYKEYYVALDFLNGSSGAKQDVEQAQFWMMQSSRKGFKQANDWLISQKNR